MDVKMHTIKAGPEGCADAGETITLPNDEAERLIEGKFAVAAVKRLPGRETAMIDPARQEQLDRDRAKDIADKAAVKEKSNKSVEAVGQALSGLDPTDDEDWTANGKPSMSRVKDMTGSTTLTRAELDGLYPDFSRPAGGEIVAGDAVVGEMGTEVVQPPASGARTNNR